jgi:hypothetical protein
MSCCLRVPLAIEALFPNALPAYAEVITVNDYRPKKFPFLINRKRFRAKISMVPLFDNKLSMSVVRPPKLTTRAEGISLASQALPTYSAASVKLHQDFDSQIIFSDGRLEARTEIHAAPTTQRPARIATPTFMKRDLLASHLFIDHDYGSAVLTGTQVKVEGGRKVVAVQQSLNAAQQAEKQRIGTLQLGGPEGASELSSMAYTRSSDLSSKIEGSRPSSAMAASRNRRHLTTSFKIKDMGGDATVVAVRSPVLTHLLASPPPAARRVPVSSPAAQKRNFLATHFTLGQEPSKD